MCRYRRRYELGGVKGLLDRRRCRPSEKRVPLETVERVLMLYRERYFDFNVQHFHEKLGKGHGIQLSYTWVKVLLQGAGLVAKGRHRKRRPWRPLPGMLLHAHRWQPAPLVAGRALVRSAGDSGRYHRPDLLGATGGGGVDEDGDGGLVGGNREAGSVLRLV
jgi:hypothetical protein